MSDFMYVQDQPPRIVEVQGKFADNLAGNFATKIDEATTATTYVGEAPMGALASAAVWRIKRLVCTGGLLTVTWADGNDSFDNIWDNRASLSYS